MRTDLFLNFPDAATALDVVRTLTGNPEAEAIPPDCWIAGVNTVFDVVFGTGVVPRSDGTPAAGYHVNAVWSDVPETLPELLVQYRLDPDPVTPACVIG